MRPPTTADGHGASASTKARAAASVRKSQRQSALIRTLLVTISIPLSAGSAYLMLAEQNAPIDASIGRIAPPTYNPAAADVFRYETARKPSTPVIAQTIAPPAGTPITTGTLLRAPSSLQHPVHLKLDANGKLVSPFSLVLDGSGLEIGRKERDEYLLQRPVLTLAGLEKAATLTSGEPAAWFRLMEPSFQLSYTDADRRRLSSLIVQAPEMRRAVQATDAFVRGHQNKGPIAIESLRPGSGYDRDGRLSAALTELRWLGEATLSMAVHGDRSPERRIEDSLLHWANTYRPSGDAVLELPFLQALKAYEYTRASLSNDSRSKIEELFVAIVEAQFLRMRQYREYDRWHAAHTLFTLATGLSLRRASLQYHGIMQFDGHTQYSNLARKAMLEPEDVERVRYLVHTAILLDRSGAGSIAQNFKPDSNLAVAIDKMALAAPRPELRADAIQAVSYAVYFKPQLLPLLVKLTGQTQSRFGTNDAVIWAALRRPDSSVDSKPKRANPAAADDRRPARLPERKTDSH